VQDDKRTAFFATTKEVVEDDAETRALCALTGAELREQIVSKKVTVTRAVAVATWRVRDDEAPPLIRTSFPLTRLRSFCPYFAPWNGRTKSSFAAEKILTLLL
jgi:hypothetical protein